jgi:hypothetical protein
MKMKGMVQV